MPEVDVVLATFNRHRSLARTLRGLSRQTFRDFRVFLVDDGSSPPVAETLSPETLDGLDVRLLRQENAGPAAARNLAIAEGTAPIVAFIDDDVVPDPDWLAAHLAALDAPNTVSIGPLLAPPDWKPSPWTRWEAEQLAAEYERMRAGEYEPTWRQFFTGNAVVPRELLERAGPFRVDFLRGEDVELGIRLRRAGARFVFTFEARGWHYAERPLRTWLALPRMYAEHDRRLDALHPDAQMLRIVQRELDQRHPAVRRAASLARRVPGLHHVMVRTGVRAAIWLDALRFRSLSSRALSLAYDLEYRASLARVLAYRDGAQMVTSRAR